MSAEPLFLLRPSTAEQFERWCLVVFRAALRCERLRPYGRRGQGQSGIDLVGPDAAGRLVAVQCKLRNQQLRLSEQDIKADIRRCDEADVAVGMLIIATTAARDTHTQDILHRLDAERRADGKYLVDLWFWEDISDFLNEHPPLRSRIYGGVAQQDAQLLAEQQVTSRVSRLVVESSQQGIAAPSWQAALQKAEAAIRETPLLAITRFQDIRDAHWSAATTLERLRILRGFVLSYLVAGEHDKAIETAREACALDLTDAASRSLLGRALDQAGHFREALGEHEHVLELDSKYTDAHYDIALAYHHLGDLETASIHYQEFLSHEPRNPYAWRDLGLAFQQLDRMNEAEAAYEAARRLAPDFAEVYNDLGLIAKQRGQLDRAAAYYRKAIELDPTYAGLRLNLGVLHADSGNVEAAKEEFARVIAIAPKYVPGHLNLGAAHERLEEWSDAERCYRAASRLRPDDATPHAYLGALSKHRGDLDAAITEFKHALDLDPNQVGALSGLGVILRWKGDMNASLELQARAVKLSPLDPQLHRNYGLALQAAGRLDEAARRYDSAIELGADHAMLYNDLAVVAGLDGRPDEAIAYYRQAVNYKSSAAAANLGAILGKQGRLNDALELLREAASWEPPSADVLHNLGVTYQVLRRGREAAQAFEQALEIDPNYEPARASLRAMRLSL